MNATQLLDISDFVVKSKNEFYLKETSVPAVIIQKLIENEDNVAMVSKIDCIQVIKMTRKIDCKSDAKWTAKQMLNAIINLAVRFYEFGIHKNDVVAFYAANSDIHTLALLAVWCIGAVYTASLQSNPLREIRNVVDDSGAVFIVSCEQNLHICEQLVNEVKVVKRIFVINGNQEKYVSVCSLLNGVISENTKEWFFKQLSAIRSNDLLKVNFSSGTTGKPKATTLRNSNLLAVMATATPGFEFILKDDTVPLVSHFSHTGGTLTLAAALLQGSKIAVVSQFESKTFIEYVQKYNITSALMVPSSINLMAKTVSTPILNFPLKKILCTGEVLSTKVADEFIAKFAPKYLGQCFGSTEMGLALMKPIFDGIERIKTIGIPTPGIVAKIVDLNTDQKLGANNVGEICLTGPQVTFGYLNNEKANQESFDKEEYFKTGDLGYFTDDGYFFFADRYKEIIKFNSLQVSPSELESIILEHESVKEAAVVGIPDSVWGQLPKAFVSLKESFNGKVTSEELLEFVNSQVADYKQLRGGLIIVSEVTKSVLGKIDKKALKSL